MNKNKKKNTRTAKNKAKKKNINNKPNINNSSDNKPQQPIVDKSATKPAADAATPIAQASKPQNQNKTQTTRSARHKTTKSQAKRAKAKQNAASNNNVAAKAEQKAVTPLTEPKADISASPSQQTAGSPAKKESHAKRRLNKQQKAAAAIAKANKNTGGKAVPKHGKKPSDNVTTSAKSKDKAKKATAAEVLDKNQANVIPIAEAKVKDTATRVENAKQKKRLSKKQWNIICAALAGVCAVSVGTLISINLKNDPAVYDEIRSLAASATPTMSAAPMAAATASSNPSATPSVLHPSPVATAPKIPGLQKSDREIDFVTLQEKNPDIFAWISVDGTDIDYPVVMSKDNLDYLKKDISGKENINGSIFMDMFNKPDLLNKITVIYGHNMKNGTMFAALHKFEDEEFFKNNREIKIYTPDGMRVYEIVASYLTGDRNILYEKDYRTKPVYQEYIDSVFSNPDEDANFIDKKPTTSDYMLTLATCERGQDTKRYFVQGVLKLDESDS